MRQARRQAKGRGSWGGSGGRDRAGPSLLAVVSHELRTPMSGMLGVTELLLETALDPVQRGYAMAIQSAMTRTLGLLDDLLDRRNSGRGGLDDLASFSVCPGAFDLPALLRQGVDLFSGRARQKGLLLRLSISPETPCRVWGDANRLVQVLMNLLANAVRFTASGSIEVFVEPLASDDGVSRVRFRVVDTGVGMDAQMMARLFRPYAQASSSQGGTGLGLAISHALAGRMGGELVAESVPGQGSTFILSLPLPVLDGEAGSFASVDAARPGPGVPGGRVLLAEDDALNREVMLAMLASLGCSVCCAGDGRQAVDLACREDFDLVLLDCRMPVLDGWAAACEIRRRESAEGRRRVPIVALTASATLLEQENCRASGMDDLLLKPPGKAGLASLLQRWVGGASVAPGECLDRQVLRGLWLLEKAGRPGLLGRVVGLFMDRARDWPGELLAACMAENAGQVQHLAHNLRSVSAHVGATVLSALAVTLEDQVRQGTFRFDSAGRVVQAMEVEFQRASLALLDHMEQLRHE